MHDDPSRYWQDLTANYRRMSDGELLQLAEKPEDLTEVAQQVLRDEMKLRKLEKPQPPAFPAKLTSVPRRNHATFGIALAGGYAVPSDSEDEDDVEGEDGPAHEFTWKTLLCDCRSNEHALQLRAALARHGIECWVTQVPSTSTDIVGPQVHVAADQLEEAQSVAAQPIPQDIIDEWNAVVPEFEVPACPQCGSKEDVVLESTEPVNAWFCEACDAEWVDLEPGEEETPAAK